MCMTDGSTCEVLEDARHVDRQPRKCGECRRDMPAGELYLRVYMVYEGDYSSHRLCAHCEAASQWLIQVCDGYLCGGMWEDLKEHFADHWYPVKTASLGRMIVAARDGWRRKDGTLWPVETIARWAEAGIRLAVIAEAA